MTGTPAGLDPATISEIIEMALSDHTSFARSAICTACPPIRSKR